MAVVPLTVHLPEELWRAASRWASREGNENAVVIRALEEFLTRGALEDGVKGGRGNYAELVRNLSTPVADLHLSARIAACLHLLNIRYVYELVVKSPGDLWSMPKFGKKSLQEIQSKLAALGLSLGMTLDDKSYAAAVTAALVANMRAAKDRAGTGLGR